MKSAKPLALAFGIVPGDAARQRPRARTRNTAIRRRRRTRLLPRRAAARRLGWAGVRSARTTCGDVCGGGFSGEFHIGGMVNPRLALMGDFWGVFHPWDDGGGYSARPATASHRSRCSTG